MSSTGNRVQIGVVIRTSLEMKSLLHQLSEVGLKVEPITYDGDLEIPWTVYSILYQGGIFAVIIESYVGRDNAAAATEFLIMQHRPEIILHAGLAGSALNRVLPGDIVISAAARTVAPESVMEDRRALSLPTELDGFLLGGNPAHYETLGADQALMQIALAIANDLVSSFGIWNAPGWPRSVSPRPAQVLQGIVGTAEHETRRMDDLRYYATHFSGTDLPLLGVDTESAAIFARAAAYGISRWLAILVISDNAYQHRLIIGSDRKQAVMTAAAARANAILVQLILRILVG